MKRLPVQSTPPAPGLGASGSQPPFQGQHPVQTSGSLPPRRDVQPTVAAPTHPPPAVAAPAAATQGHPVPGYYHHEYYIGVPVGPQAFYTQSSGPGW